ncbi:MAG: hypothetical protein A3K59_05600 [Euryarchaeota archaeon RBG_19FT_COMBO_69_17]|nr:MAG: hypothetical protein A3K59_05600 [Euryarchaeota archaeon RBG_19FT_COMBO_69_17]
MRAEGVRRKASGNLASLPPGTTASIVAIETPDAVRRQLLSLGVFEGVRIRVLRRAPLGGAILVAVGSSEYALGREIASRIRVATG